MKAAEVPGQHDGRHTDILIVESTYGVQTHMSREERESKFTTRVDEIVRNGGKCLIPVFATGRAQELLLILDEHWQANPDLQAKVPVFYASKLASKALRVYQTFVNMMNNHISTISDIRNPFHFKFIKNAFEFDESGAMVVMASPGMLQSGLSRKLCER